MNFVFYLHDEQDPVLFEQKLLWFKKRYNLVSCQDIIGHLYNGKPLHNACHLTVDDGWRSTYDVIFPVMKKYGVPFTIFVSPEICRTQANFWYKDLDSLPADALRLMLIERGYYMTGIDKCPIDLLLKELPIDDVYTLLADFRSRYALPNPERGFINVEELREMNISGLVEIGAHTLTHPILASEPAERSEHEIKASVEQLSDILDKEVRAFAYPNGLCGVDFGRREMDYARQAGIKVAFSVDPGVLSAKSEPMAIPRIGSEKRLLLGRLGTWLPSITNQKGVRRNIRTYRINH